MAETSGEFTTVIGPDAKFDGNLSFEKGLKLQGNLKGTLKTPGRLHVTKEAQMEADVDAGSIVIEGEVKGKLSASDRIELKQSARYNGDLTASKLVVDEGAVFEGHVSVGPDTSSKPRPSSSPGLSRSSGGPSGSPAGQPAQSGSKPGQG